jgi:hypothetical protein
VEEQNEFLKVAGLLGHDKNRLMQGEEIITYIRIPTITQAASILSRANFLQRAKRAETFFDEIRGRARMGQGIHDRGEAVVFAYGQPLVSDTHGLERHFPLRVKAISIKEKRIKAGECFDVSTRGSDWGIDHMEELYCIVNIHTLILEPGASIVVRGNVFSMVCQHIIKLGSDEVDKYDIGILPTPYAFHSDGSGNMNGADGKNGQKGNDAAVVKDVETKVTFFGALYYGEQTKAVSGERGEDGEDGQKGEDGKAGGATKLAEITIRDIDAKRGKLCIYAKAGDGGNGGHGGNGGDAGNGSNGQNGYQTLKEWINQGQGGDGGNGGNGGNGGHGGNGGIASNVYICVEKEQKDSVKIIAEKGFGGLPGKGGMGGRAGLPGNGNPSGKEGHNGANGITGRKGHNRMAPPVFLNEVKLSCTD